MKFIAHIKADALSLRANDLFADSVTNEDYKAGTALVDKFVKAENEDIRIEFDTEAGTATLLEAEE